MLNGAGQPSFPGLPGFRSIGVSSRRRYPVTAHNFLQSRIGLSGHYCGHNHYLPRLSGLLYRWVETVPVFVFFCLHFLHFVLHSRTWLDNISQFTPSFSPVARLRPERRRVKNKHFSPYFHLSTKFVARLAALEAALPCHCRVNKLMYFD